MHLRMDPVTDITSILSQLDAAEKAATEERWIAYQGMTTWGCFKILNSTGGILLETTSHGRSSYDATLIALMRNSLRPLLSHVAALEAERDRLLTSLNFADKLVALVDLERVPKRLRDLYGAYEESMRKNPADGGGTK